VGGHRPHGPGCELHLRPVRVAAPGNEGPRGRLPFLHQLGRLYRLAECHWRPGGIRYPSRLGSSTGFANKERLPGRPLRCSGCPGVTPARAAARRRAPTVHVQGNATVGTQLAPVGRCPTAPLAHRPTNHGADHRPRERAGSALPVPVPVTASEVRPGAFGVMASQGDPVMDHANGGVEPVSSVEVTPAGRQALFLVLRATSGPGSEDPRGRLRPSARTPSVTHPPTGGVHLFAGLIGGQRACFGWPVGSPASQPGCLVRFDGDLG
jgi:hypothetical protein